MGFLAPLYIAGLLAIGLPILFHLLRRSPHGKQVFSSLMFLQQSPPRLTRRSRLNNILLLILRALAFILLAFAFARPFFQWGDNIDTYQATGRRIALLMDTSASMQRADLWNQAMAKAQEELAKVSANDEVALYTFDSQVRPVFTFDEWNQTQTAGRIAAIKERLATLKPGWGAAKMGDALAAVADVMSETGKGGKGGGPEIDKLVRHIVLVSDMKQGSRAETLQGHQWPDNVTLDVKAVTPRQPGNASVQWVKQVTQEAAPTTMASDTQPAVNPNEQLRVRVSNEADSKNEQFTLTWQNAKGPVQGVEPVKVYVPAGRSQIVRVDWPKEGQEVDRLVLGGDDNPFDNTLYVVAPRKQTLRVVFVGEDDPLDVRGLNYYLQSALADTRQRQVEWLWRKAGESLAEGDLENARLVVIGGEVSDEQAGRLRAYLQQGGQALWVLKDLAAAQSPGARALVGGTWKAEEDAGGFALIGRVDLGHPLFAPFAEAKFSDFTKIHFWRHRRLTLPADASARVLASFDSGDPFLLECTAGKGTLHVLTSGWQPADSQLALSTKFVPLMEEFLAGGAVQDTVSGSQFVVGEAIPLPAAAPTASGSPATRPAWAVVNPEGRKVAVAAGARTFDGADKPGIYKLLDAGKETPLAVNVPPDESRTAPMAIDDLERWGVKLAAGTSEGDAASNETVTRERRLRLAELENRQKLWRWLIIGVLGLLAAETVVAGRLAHRSSNKQATS